jgi:hypothetical protein
MGCGDPALDARVDALGPEAPGVEQGPEHRPGQPCATCHRDSGPGSPNFSVAGTVYQDAERILPLVGARLDFVDSMARRYTVHSNCVGNFYVEMDDWRPRCPLWVRLTFGELGVAMQTPIHRERSCAECHAEPSGPDSLGHVYLSEAPLDPTPGGCE